MHAGVHGGAVMSIQRRHEPVQQFVTKVWISRCAIEDNFLPRLIHAESEILRLDVEAEAVGGRVTVHRIHVLDLPMVTAGMVAAIMAVPSVAGLEPVLRPVGSESTMPLTLHAPDALTGSMERVIQDAALPPVVAAVGAEAPLHRPDMSLLPAQARYLPAAQPTAPDSMPDACPLSDLAAIHAALEAARIGPVLHGRLPLLMCAPAVTPISRVGRSHGAEHQCRDHRHCD
jgi:hypothetical protein